MTGTWRNVDRSSRISRSGEALLADDRGAPHPLVATCGVEHEGGTFYRNFPNREALVFEIYRHETQQLTDHAAELLQTRDPDQALREWMDRLAQYAMTKTGLADAIRQVTTAPVSSANPAYTSVVAAVELLLRANEKAGTIRPGITADDFILAIAGLWQIDPHGDWRPKATRLLDLVMAGVRVRTPQR